MHLGQLELCLRAGSCWKAHIADDVSQSLSINKNLVSIALSIRIAFAESQCFCAMCWRLRVLNVPLWFVRRENLPLGVIANDLDVDEPTKVKLLRSEHRHVDRMVESWGSIDCD